MGRAKEQMMENQEQEDVVSFFKELARMDVLEEVIAGIARQIFGKGLDTLTEIQRSVVDKYIKKYKEQNICKRCENDNIGELTDYIVVSEEGLCPTCQYDKERFMKD